MRLHGATVARAHPRRVLFLCPKLDNGGAERHWAGLLPALRDHGIAVRILALEGGGRALDELRADIPVRELGVTGLSSIRAVPRVLAERRGRPDAVVTFGYNAHVVGAVFARLANVAHIVNWHRQQGFPMTAIERAAVRTAASLGAGAIAVTSAQREDLRDLGFPDARVRVIPNGVRPPTDSSKCRPSLRQAAGIPPDALLVLAVARLRPEKRIADFIHAIKLANRDNPGIHGLVVGDGPLAAKLAAEARTVGAPVTFLGHHPEPTQWMQASDIVCLPSQHEALPMALIEGIACGQPCVATDVGGTGEIVRSGENGILVPPGDVPALARGITALAQSPALRQTMGRRSLEIWRETFSFDTMVQHYSALLSTCSGPPTSWADTGRFTSLRA